MSTIKIFISYSHQDTHHMQEVRQFLQGLEKEGVEFWTDERIATGELWNEEIKRKIAESEIALALVSQAFLDSPYCTRIEIGTLSLLSKP